MKVVYILSSNSPFGGSTKSFMRMLGVLMDAYKIKPMVICPMLGGVSSALQEWGVEVRSVKFRNNTYPQKNGIKNIVLYPLRFIYHWAINKNGLRKIKKEIKKFGPELIHTNVGVVNLGQKAAKALGLPHVYHLREYQDADFGMRIMPSMTSFKQSLKDSDNFSICITRGIQNHFDLDDTNSRVIYDGVFSINDAIEQKDCQEKENKFLFVGRLEDAKGIKDVLRAFSIYREEGGTYGLEVIGKETVQGYEDGLRDYCRANGLEEFVNFLGWREDVSNYMRKDKAVIVASEFEGFGLVTVEAMHNNCLVIGRNTSGTKEQFDNARMLDGIKGEIGLRFNNIDELTSHLISLDEGLEISQIIKDARRTVETLYTIEGNARNVFSLYERITLKRS